jgi:hypothetical protein
MPQLYLPAAHTDADLVLASQIAARIDSAELHVAWSPGQGQVIPEVSALVREPAIRSLGLFGLIGAVWRAVFGRDVAAVPTAPASPAADAPQRKPASDPS